MKKRKPTSLSKMLFVMTMTDLAQTAKMSNELSDRLMKELLRRAAPRSKKGA